MTRSPFADYARNNPSEYQAFSDSLWNGFVTVTHAIGLNRFFSFTPDFLQGEDEPKSGRFSEGEIPGDKELEYTQLTLW
jgi:hypothetical protein